MSHDMYNFLLEKAQNMEGLELVEHGDTTSGSGRIHQSIHVDPKVEPTKLCKKLLLGSGDIQLAEAIDRYIRVSFDGKIVYGAKKPGPYAVYTSLLTCFDNVWSHYKVEDFCREVFKLLVNTPEYCCEKLQCHLDKTETSYQRLVLDLAAGANMNAACNFYLAAASLHLDQPIMLIKPKQRTDRRGIVHYEFYQEYLFPEDENRQRKDFKIWLVYNGVNYYAPFYGKEPADLILDGNPVMLQIQKSYQDVKNLVRCLPKNTCINGAIQQFSIHLRVGALIAETVRFQSGVGDTSPVSQLPFPVNTGVLAEPVVRKRKSATTTTDTQDKSAQPSLQPAATGPTAAKVAKVSVTSPIGSDRTDIDLMPNQCHCGEAYADAMALKRHIKVVHKNDYWACSGEWVSDDGTESRCPQVCKDKFALWKHFRTQHQDRYLHYYPVEGCKWGMDEISTLPQHVRKFHKRKPDSDVAMHALVCPKCKHNFAQKHKMNNHILICGTEDRPFACNKCEYMCRSTDQLRVHKKQKHPATPGDWSGFYQCDYCPKEYTSMSAWRRHMKGVHKHK